MHNELASFINSNAQGANATVNQPEIGDHSITVESAQIYNVCKCLKEGDYDFNVLQVISGVDYKDHIEINYMLASFTKGHEVTIKTKVNYGNINEEVEVDSVTSLWAAADFQERETYDLLGVRFKNHPDMRRILCPYDWEGYPLRKEYKVQEKYHKMTVNPEDKINSADHIFAEKLKEKYEPKLVAGSWKWGDK